MHKRDFLAGAALAGLLPAAAPAVAATTVSAPAGPVLLTVGGAVSPGNRGALDKVRDQMMGKHDLKFSRATAFDAAALARLPTTRFRVTLEYDNQLHELQGPLLTTVLEAAGADLKKPLRLGLRAVDGYNADLTLAEVQEWRVIVATHMDGQPLALGGLGPQWAIYEADALPAFRSKPVNERFVYSPWGMYYIDVAVT